MAARRTRRLGRVGGWTNTILTARSGPPYSPAVIGDVANIGNTIGWWNQPGCVLGSLLLVRELRAQCPSNEPRGQCGFLALQGLPLMESMERDFETGDPRRSPQPVQHHELRGARCTCRGNCTSPRRSFSNHPMNAGSGMGSRNCAGCAIPALFVC
jgi:hypothetical protein